jgi:hypothetical protein
MIPAERPTGPREYGSTFGLRPIDPSNARKCSRCAAWYLIDEPDTSEYADAHRAVFGHTPE